MSTGHTASASKLHYAGHKGSCATALSIPLTQGRHTWNPSDVTCKRCLTELRRFAVRCWSGPPSVHAGVRTKETHCDGNAPEA